MHQQGITHMSNPEWASKKVQIIWITNGNGNTGKGGSLGELLGSQCAQFLGQGRQETVAVKPKLATFDNLHKWCLENDFVEHNSDLLKQLGLHLRVFAEKYEFRNEHRGRNNILATYLTCQPRTGLAKNTIIGKAAVVRVTEDGEPVDFNPIELLRCLLFVNDLMDLYGDTSCLDDKTATIKPQVLKEAAAVFPYYWFDDTFVRGGFSYSGMSLEHRGRYCQALTRADGSIYLRMKPTDMEVAESYVL